VRFVRHLVSALVGAAIAGAVVLTAASLGGEDVPRADDAPRTETAPVEVDTRRERRRGNLFLAWAPTSGGGLPADAERVLEGLRGVRGVAIGAASIDWMTSARGPGGALVGDPPTGLAIPVEIMAVDPAEHAVLAPPSDRAALEGLGTGEILFSETGAALRGDVATVTLSSGPYTVAGVISDAAANGYEMVVRGPPPSAWQIVDRFALVHATSRRVRERVKIALTRRLAAGQVLRVRAKGETPYLRYGDAVMPQAIIKESFGEFAARPLPDGTLVIDPAWTERNVVRSRVPILGEVACHRALFPQLRHALAEVERKGLSFLIDTSQYGGCYGPRSIGRIPGGRLSHHAWGIAIDVNAADNAFGTRPDLDRRIVAIMERFGFTWGGRWLVPDGMHFEWVRFP